MSTYQIATLAQGVGGLADITTLLTVSQADPFPAPFTDYAEVVGTDLNSAPIEAGLPRCKWTWEFLPQADFNVLLGYCSGMSASVYIRTRKNDGTFAVYKAVMLRPKGEPRMGTQRDGVEIEFVNLEVQS